MVVHGQAEWKTEQMNVRSRRVFEWKCLTGGPEEGPPALNNLPELIGFAACSFLRAGGMLWELADSPEGTCTV